MAVLTNISPEHLDYHKTIEDYANCKKRLFLNVVKNLKPTKYAVLPKDDEWGRLWMEEMYFDKMLDY
jgi:UDP-N-acetylmuramyl tripeptide synthase